MTKSDLADQLCRTIGDLSKREALEYVDTVFNTMKRFLTDGEKVMISGFGKFETRQKKDRKGRDPQTGKPIIIPARRVVTFKPSDLLKKQMGKG